MSFTQAMWWSLLRTVVVACAAVGAGVWVAQHLAAMRSGRRRAWLIGMLAAVAATPALWTGYAYAHRGLSLVHHRWANEWLYVSLVAMRWLPLAVAVLYFMPPPPMSRSAMHLARMGGGHVPIFLGPLRNVAVAWAVLFLFAFQEFELASQLLGSPQQRPPWTVWLFDAQTAGLMLGRSLALAAWPVGCELAVLASAGWLLWKGRGMQGREREASSPRAWISAAAWTATVAAFSGVTLIPFAVVGWEMLPALIGLARDFSIGREIVVSTGFALVGVAGAMGVARLVDPGLRRLGPGLWVLMVPGLLGPLVLALLVQALFLLPGVNVLYDTPVPLLVALVWLLTPGAWALRGALRRVSPTTALHVAGLLDRGDEGQRRAAERVRWSLRGRMRLAAAALLFVVAYYELVASDLLQPTGMAGAVSLLYNQMHYEHNNRLSAMVFAVGLAPVLVYAAAWVILRLSSRLERPWARRSGG